MTERRACPFRLFPIILALAVMAAGAGPQETGPSLRTVAVRVFDAGRFVDSLTLSDFEVLEDGTPQQVRSLTKFDKNAITRQEGETGVRPDTARQFYFLFQMYDYDPKISQALNYFFNSVLLPGDTLEIQTPVTSYALTPRAFAQKPKDLLAKETNDLVRKDINKGNFVYKSLLRDLRRFVQGIQGSNPVTGGDDAEGGMVSAFGLEQTLVQYRDSLAKLEAQQGLDPAKIVGFAQALKNQAGRKFVILFYQQEYRPQLNTQTLHALIDNNQDNQNVLSGLQDLFQVYHRDISIDVDRIVQAYCDSGADINFLFLKRTPDKLGGVEMREQSEDVFTLFSRIAEATGGVAATAQNPLAELKNAVGTMESYYLLTYAPAPAVGDGAFRKISVTVKGKPYKVSFGQGYFSR